MNTKSAENLVLIVGATVIFFLGARLVRLLVFSAYGLGRMLRYEKISSDSRDD